EVWGKPDRDPNTPEFLALNPNAQVPVLREGEFVLWESSAIMRYLIDQHGPGDLVPRNAQTRARAEQWFAWQATDLNGCWMPAVLALVRKTPGPHDPTAVADSVKRWTAKMRIFRIAVGGDQGLCRWRCVQFRRRPHGALNASLVWRRL